MFKRTNALLLFISILPLSLDAMDKGPLRRAISQDSILDSSHTKHGDKSKKIIKHAFYSNLPEDTIVRSDYVKDATSQQQLVDLLVNMPLVKKETVTIKPGGSSTVLVENALDIRNAEKIMARAVLEIERPKIVKETREDERKNLSFIQQNPITSILLALAVGASLPFVLPELMKTTKP